MTRLHVKAHHDRSLLSHGVCPACGHRGMPYALVARLSGEHWQCVQCREVSLWCRWLGVLDVDDERKGRAKARRSGV